MKELFLTSVLGQMESRIPSLELNRLARVLEAELAQYDMMQASTALVPYQEASDSIRMFLVSKKLENLSPLTLENYKTRLTHFCMTIGKSLNKADSMDLRRYFVLLASRGIKDSTLGSCMTPLRSFYAWAQNTGMITLNPMAVIKPPNIPKPECQALTGTEMERVRIACETLRDRAMVEVYYSTGCRVSELHKKNISDIDWQTGTLSVLGKGRKHRQVRIKADAMVHLRRYLETRKGNDIALFTIDRKPYTRLCIRAIQEVFTRLGERAQIQDGLHPHLMRHTLATNMV